MMVESIHQNNQQSGEKKICKETNGAKSRRHANGQYGDKNIIQGSSRKFSQINLI